MQIELTHIGTATVKIKVGNICLLTDPAFDPSGTQYSWAPLGADSTKLEEPAISAENIGSFDAILVTHAQHDDNLDPRGRALFSKARRIITTQPSAKRLGNNVEGLAVWKSTDIQGEDGLRIRITGVPARHGPPFSLPFVGRVIGFILEWEGQTHGAVYISGDTVLFKGIHEIAKRFSISLALLHLGQAKLPVMGPFKLTMNGKDGAAAARILQARTVVPIHYDGWTHFTETKEAARQAFEAAGLTSQMNWLPKGQSVNLEI